MVQQFFAFQSVTYFMIIPSTLLTLLLNYVAFSASPHSMKLYKYVIVATSLFVYQFDFVDSILLCPVNLYKSIGLQFYGYLGKFCRPFNATGSRIGLGPVPETIDNIPTDGFYLAETYCISLSTMAGSIIFSFIWREYALIPFKVSAFSVVTTGLHFLSLFVLIIAYFPFFQTLKAYDSLTVEFLLNWRPEYYSVKYAIFIIQEWNVHAFANFGIYLFVLIVIGFSFVVKAIYRIMRAFDNVQLSAYTISIHRMLLKCLIIQLTAPIAMFIIPILSLIIVAYLNNILNLFPIEFVDKPAAQIGAVLITIPSFFSTVHVSTVIYYTTPYRAFIKKKLGMNVAIRKFPDYHFIARAEKEDSHARQLAKNASNLHVFSWIPQPAVLRHPRLKAFITHAGYNSLMETARSGVPIIPIPIMLDQPKNSLAVKRAGWGLPVSKIALKNRPDLLIKALREVLRGQKYKDNARRIANLIRMKPTSGTTRLLQNTEFAIANGGMKELLTDGRHYGAIKYFNLDILLATFVIYWVLKRGIRLVVWLTNNQQDVEKEKIQ